MSVESQLADFVNLAAQNIALPQVISNTATARINDIAGAFTTTIANMSRTFYVSATGSDTNTGLTPQSPLATIQKAIALTPRAAKLVVLLMSDITLTEDVVVDHLWLRVTSDTSTRRRIQFTRYTTLSGGSTYRSIKSFLMVGRAALLLDNVIIAVPAADGDFAAALVSAGSAIVRFNIAYDAVPHCIVFQFCTIEMPASNYGPLIGHLNLPLILLAQSITESVTALLGKWLLNITNTAGTARFTATTGHILTNLSAL